MAMCIEVINTDKEDQFFVYYNYQYNILDVVSKKLKLVEGLVKIDKKKGDVDIVEYAPGDKGAYAQHAALALMRHWKKGEFPEKAYWNS